ncbi:glycosyltransferase family 4 protein [Thomasclavelia spiroformis DSM 1552]|nr:glycosyltransferase family 4 protein [Thomasclavelia spiroformis]UWO88736.1 glycosyltransferase family 4 protein [Thomasclavelia spiroformis DSM 1552]
MRVLLVSPLPPPTGGIATWSLKFLEYCRNNNINVVTINTAIIGKRGKFYGSKRNPFTEIYRLVKIIRLTLKTIKKKEISIAHVNSSCSKLGIFKDYLIIKILSKKKIPIIFQCHCNICDQINNNTIQKFFLKRICKKVKLVMTLNMDSLNYIKEMGIINCKIFPNFIDDDFLIDIPKKVNEKINKVVYVGHVSIEKGVQEILWTAERFKDIEFILLGSIHYGIDVVQIPNNVKFLGNKKHEEIIYYLDQADVFVFPSYSEGFSLALLEAMSRGLPIIATDVGNNKELLENKIGKGGIIIDPRDKFALYNAMISIKDKEIRKNFSLFNYNISKKYVKSKVLGDLIVIYNTIIEMR